MGVNIILANKYVEEAATDKTGIIFDHDVVNMTTDLRHVDFIWKYSHHTLRITLCVHIN